MNRRPTDQPWYALGLRFTCTQCGNCCTGPPGYVWFTDTEAAAMAQYIGLATEQFLARFTKVVNGRPSLEEIVTEAGEYDCVFLKTDPTTGKRTCSIYAVRPQQCRTWPFWPENLQSPRNWRRAAQRCPGMQQGLDGQGDFYPVEKIRIIRDSQ